MTIQFRQLSDHALFAQFGATVNEKTQQTIQQRMQQLQQQPFPGLVELVPGYTNFCVYYDPYIVHKRLYTSSNLSSAARVMQYIEQLIAIPQTTSLNEGRIIEIPVIYGGHYGPDLEEVAKINHLTCEQVIEIHCAKPYLVYMLGFAPGFPFLGGLDERIATPRRTIPRLQIAAGSVGIGGQQTGIYPFETPGGWQIIGRTMTPLFSIDDNPPTLLQAGDRVQFIPH